MTKTNMKRIKAMRSLVLRLLSGALCILLGAACAVAADDDRVLLHDFSIQRQIDAREDGMLHRVRLTPDVLRDAGAEYRGDIAVFNASGDLVPFARIHAPDEREDGVYTAPVPAFVMPDGEGRQTMPMDVIVRQNADGQVVEVRGSRESQGAEGGNARFLLDLTAIQRDALAEGGRISGGRIDLSLLGEESVAATVNVEASDNLRDWTRVAENEPLIRLVGESGGVRSNYVELKEVRRYLVLEVKGKAEIDPADISVSLFRKSSASAPWDSLSFEGVREEGGVSFVYDVGSSFPAERVLFSLASPGIHDVLIESKRASSDDWRYRAETTLMYVKNESGETKNGPLEGIRHAHDRYWRVSAKDALSLPPTMKLSWRPQEVVFMAQGASPYLLCTGSKRALPSSRLTQSRAMAERALEYLSVREIGVAGVGAPESIAVISDETTGYADVQEGKNWGQYAVWGLLVAGALLLSWMAWSLMHRRDDSKNSF